MPAAFSAPAALRPHHPFPPSLHPRRPRPHQTLSATHPFPHLRIAPNIPGGRGLTVHTAPIAPHKVIARLPISQALVVCFEDALPDSAHDIYPFPPSTWVSPTYWRAADWDVKLSALLLYHVLHPMLHNVPSPWSAYLSTLPTPAELSTAADLDKDALQDLQYAPLVDAVEVYQYRVAAEFLRLQRALPPVHIPLVSKARFEWAMKIVHSRAFSIPPGGFAASSTRAGLRGAATSTAEWPRKFALVPGLDMTNHGDGPSLARFRYDDNSQHFELVAGPDGYAPGSQVLVSYGKLTNDDLYLLYGFVQAGNPHDVFEVEDVSEWVAELCTAREWNLHVAKLALLERVGLCYEGRKFLLARDAIDQNLVAALRILLASPEEFRVARIAAKRRVAPDGLVVSGVRRGVPVEWYRPLSDENERMVWTRIERQCKRMLAEFPTSLELDEEMIILHAASSVPSDPLVSTQLLFRAEKKRILRQAALLAAERRVQVELESHLFEDLEFAPPNTDLWADLW